MRFNKTKSDLQLEYERGCRILRKLVDFEANQRRFRFDRELEDWKVAEKNKRIDKYNDMFDEAQKKGQVLTLDYDKLVVKTLELGK